MAIMAIALTAVLISFLATGCKKDEDDDPDAIKDGDGNVYTALTIGTQVWLTENLKTTRYNDGTAVPLVTDDVAWENLSTPGFRWYDNNASANKNTYGALYNWFAVNTGKLCPTGWHVPTDAEWTDLITFLGGASEASGKMRDTGTTHWKSPNTGATNESGINALPGGFRQSNGSFTKLGEFGVWWSSTENSSATDSAWERYLVYDFNNAYRGSDIKRLGFSVRCMKN